MILEWDHSRELCTMMIGGAFMAWYNGEGGTTISDYWIRDSHGHVRSRVYVDTLDAVNIPFRAQLIVGGLF